MVISGQTVLRWKGCRGCQLFSTSWTLAACQEQPPSGDNPKGAEGPVVPSRTAACTAVSPGLPRTSRRRGPHSGRHRALLMVASTGMGAACTWSSCPLWGGCCAVKTCLRPRSQRGLCAGMKLGLGGCPWTFILGWYLGHSRHGLWSGPGPGWWGWEGVGQAHTRTDQARAHFLNRGVSSPVWHYWCARWGESGSKLD